MMTALRIAYWLCVLGALASGMWIGFLEIDALIERRQAQRARRAEAGS